MAEQINKNEEAKNVSSDQTKHVSENRTVTQLSTTPGDTLEKVFLPEAIQRLTDIVKENEKNMAKAFANSPEWQSRAKMTMKSYRKPEEDATSETKAHVHTIIRIPTTFTKEQRAVLKDYATQMGGSYTNFKIVDKQADGSVKQSFPAQIEFSKGTAYSADICAKIILGLEQDKIFEELDRRKQAFEEKQQASQKNERKHQHSHKKVDEESRHNKECEYAHSKTHICNSASNSRCSNQSDPRITWT